MISVKLQNAQNKNQSMGQAQNTGKKVNIKA